MSLFVSLAFKKYLDDKLVSFSNTIYQRMTDDQKYASLKEYVDDIKTKNTAFILAIANAALGGKDRKDDKKTFREALIKHLVKVARQLEDLAEERGNDSRVITDASFEVRNTNRAEKEPVTALDTPVLVAKDIDKKTGWASLIWVKVSHALTYAIRHKKKSETVWQNGNYNDTGEFTFTNLEPDNVYEFEICALGPNGIASGWSRATPIYVS